MHSDSSRMVGVVSEAAGRSLVEGNSYSHRDDHPDNNIFLLSFTNKLTVVLQPPCLSNDEIKVSGYHHPIIIVAH